MMNKGCCISISNATLKQHKVSSASLLGGVVANRRPQKSSRRELDSEPQNRNTKPVSNTAGDSHKRDTEYQLLRWVQHVKACAETRQATLVGSERCQHTNRDRLP